MYVDEEEIHKYMQYEVSITSTWAEYQRKEPNWLPNNNYKSETLNI